MLWHRAAKQLYAVCALLLMLTSLHCLADSAVDPALRALLQQAINEPNNFQDEFDAQVWLQDMNNRLADFMDDPIERLTLLRTLHYEAGRANLEPELVLAVIEVESHFDRFAISVAGARGLMQVMPFWLNEINLSDQNLFKIRTNLRMGCTILRYYLDRENGNLGPALARYNGSYGRTVYPEKVIQALNRNWFKQ
ncbi:MAG: transglycosylase SLT domain-containing protein [Gammaproteobacteria bacterium]|nr:transglycosylase SLT domain-containing protein [Gammaproteobacteria bacterium]